MVLSFALQQEIAPYTDQAVAARFTRGANGSGIGMFAPANVCLRNPKVNPFYIGFVRARFQVSLLAEIVTAGPANAYMHF